MHMGQNDTFIILDLLLSLLSLIYLSSPLFFTSIKIIVSFLFSNFKNDKNLNSGDNYLYNVLNIVLVLMGFTFLNEISFHSSRNLPKTRFKVD